MWGLGVVNFSLIGNVFSNYNSLLFFFFCVFWRVLWGRFMGIGKVGGGPLLGVEDNNVDYRKIMVLERYRALCAWSRCRDVGPLPWLSATVWVGWYFRPSFRCSTRGAQFLGTNCKRNAAPTYDWLILAFTWKWWPHFVYYTVYT